MNLELAQIVTQIIGFLIALWILKKFAWKPILRLLDERKSKIKSEFDTIGQKKFEVESLTSKYETKLKDIDSLARKKIQEAAKEGQKMALDIKEAARKDAQILIQRAKEELQRDVEKAKVQLRDDLVDMTLAVTEKILQEKLDEEKHKKLITDFINEVENI